jgi:glutathione S-transferase
MRLLYHFPTSTFSRRARLALAHKGLAVELRDARADAQALAEAKRRSPLGTIPVLVDGEYTIGDSSAIAHYLDKAYPDAPALWPSADPALTFGVASLVDGAMNALVDLGTRFYPLRNDPAWDEVKKERLARIQGSLDELAKIVGALPRATISSAGWSAADIWLFSCVAWLEGMPARVATAPLVAQIMSLGWNLPPGLVKWADAHRSRADVLALG